jgi:type IX secretion system PorP/SprF family membrane protein
MKINKYIIAIIIVKMLTISLFAQQDPMYSQYMFNTLSLNPAYAGTSGKISAVLLSRHQWLGLEAAPQTQTFAIHSPLKNKTSLGLSVIKDKAGPINNLSFQANYSYNINLSNTFLLYFGLMAGINNVNVQLVAVEGVEFNDFAFSQNINAFRPVFGFGLYLNNPKFYTGFSIPDILETSYTNNVNSWDHKRHYYFIAGHLTNLTDNLKLRSTMMMRYVENSPFSADLTLSAIIKDLFWIGGIYRLNDAAGLLFALQINPELRIGYSYDYSLNVLKSTQTGSHELMISYDFNYQPTKYISPRYF